MFKRAALRSTLLITTMVLATACTAAPDAADTAGAASPATAVAAASSTASTAAAVVASSAVADASPPAAASTAAAATAAVASGAAATAAVAPPKGMPAGATPVEGVDYSLIDTPDQPSGPKVQVVEVFGFGCIHCWELQPDLSTWLKSLPSDVQFTYLPGPFGGMPDGFERGFYAAQAMGVQDKSHDGIFKAVWVDKRIATPDDIPKVYADYGVDPKVFASTMQSFAVSAKIAAGNDQEVRWGIPGTPSIVVDGKYRAGLTLSGGPKGMLHTVDWLIAKQRSEHTGH